MPPFVQRSKKFRAYLRPARSVGGTADSVGSGQGACTDEQKRCQRAMRRGVTGAPPPCAPGQGLSPALYERNGESAYAPAAGMKGVDVSLSPRDADFSMFPPPGGLAENRLHVRQDAPAEAVPATARQSGPSRPEGRAARPPSVGRTKKRSPVAGASHHAARKGERYQRLALKKASILSKGMMSTRSYRSVCEAPGTISSSLLSPLSFLKASSLK